MARIVSTRPLFKAIKLFLKFTPAEHNSVKNKLI